MTTPTDIRFRGIPTLRMPFNPNPRLDDASCLPWTGLHDSQQPWERDTVFQKRLDEARTVCDSCPARDACAGMVRHYRAHRVNLDGIFAGHHLQYGGDAT